MLGFTTPKLAYWAPLGWALFAAGCGNDPNAGMPPPMTTATVSSAVQATGVPVPDYVPDTGFLGVKVDALGAAQLSGQIRLQFGRQPAEMYVVTTSDPGTTTSGVDAAYQAGVPTPIVGSPVSVPAATLQLTAVPGVRYLVLSHSLASAPSIRSYQVLSFHFVGP